MALEPQCGDCKYKQPRAICGNAQSTHFREKVESKWVCDFYVEHPGQGYFHEAWLKVLAAGSSVAGMEDFKKALDQGLPEDDEVFVRFALAEGYVNLAVAAKDRLNAEQLVASPDFLEALNQAEKAIRIDRQGQYGYFSDPLNRARLRPFDESYNLTGLVLKDTRGIDGAITYLQQKVGLLAFLPTNPLLLATFTLGNLLVEKGQKESAARCYKNIVTSEPVLRGDETRNEQAIRREAAEKLNRLSSCLSCGELNKPGAAFCKKCGARLSAPPEPPATAIPSSASQPIDVGGYATGASAAVQPVSEAAVDTSARLAEESPAYADVSASRPPIPAPAGAAGGLSPAVKAGIGSALVLLVGLVGFLLYWNLTAVQRRFDDAVRRGQLMGIGGVLDLYDQALREKGPGSSIIVEMGKRAQPLLRQKSDQEFDSWYRDGELAEGMKWSDVAKLQELLSGVDSSSEMRARQYFAGGQALFMSDRFTDARNLFEKGLAEKREWVLALNAIGRAYYRQRVPGMAEQYYRRAAAADSNWYFVHANLAALLIEQSRMSEAEAEYQRAIQLQPNRAVAHYNLARLYDSSKRNAEACNEYRQAVSLAGQAPAGFDYERAQRRIQAVCGR